MSVLFACMQTKLTDEHERLVDHVVLEADATVQMAENIRSITVDERSAGVNVYFGWIIGQINRQHMHVMTEIACTLLTHISPGTRVCI